MKQIAPDLWQSSLYQTGILNTHAYFLERPSGNVLFYNTGDDDDLRHISEHGGVAYQLLTHRDEAGASQLDFVQIQRASVRITDRLHQALEIDPRDFYQLGVGR